MRRVGYGLLLVVLLVGYMPAPVVAQEGTGGVWHTVQAGETLYRIALRYGVSVQALMAANALQDPNAIFVGQVLRIPQSDTTGNAQELADGESQDLGLLGVSMAPPELPPAPIASGFSQPDLGLLGVDMPVVPSNATDEPPADVPVSPTSPPTFAQAEDLGILTPETAAWLGMGFISAGGPRMRAIYVQGLAQGNNPHAFSKIGDCNSQAPFFLAKFDTGEYDLGPYAYLQDVVEHFAGSFSRESLAVWSGNHVWAVLDPLWANPAFCRTGETPLACEFRVNRPSLVLIRLGTNEVGSPQLFEDNLRQVIEFSLENGVIPVLGTKADRLEGSDAMNDIIRALAAEYQVPLWDFGKAAEHIPGRGLMPDGFHLTYAPPYYNDPAALQSGHGLQNLMALMALDAVWRAAMYLGSRGQPPKYKDALIRA